MRVVVVVIAFLVGLMVGAAGLHIVQQKAIQRLEKDLKKEKVVRETVEKDLKDARREMDDVRRALSADLDMAWAQLAEKDAEIERLRAEVKKLKEVPGSKTAETPKERQAEKAETYEKTRKWAKNLQEAVWNGLVIGEKVPDETAEKLGINDVEKQIIEEELEKESERVKQALCDFLREDMGRDVSGLDEKSLVELVGVLFDKKMQEEIMDFYTNLKPEDYKDLMEGRKDLLDIMGRDSLLAKLGYRLWKARKQTLDDLQLSLSEETMGKLKNLYLRPDIFILPPRATLSYIGADFSKMEK